MSSKGTYVAEIENVFGVRIIVKLELNGVGGSCSPLSNGKEKDGFVIV